ncbi:hypothetical protein FACS189426_02840 [Bacteroidia bacterium]|nr:hypothetical protein FACS189426_02840 [Bacteroidia bacterium]
MITPSKSKSAAILLSIFITNFGAKVIKVIEKSYQKNFAENETINHNFKQICKNKYKYRIIFSKNDKMIKFLTNAV